jgi:hypothetical protein
MTIKTDPPPPPIPGLSAAERAQLRALLAKADALKGLAGTPQEREAKRRADVLAKREARVAQQLAVLQSELDAATTELNDLISQRIFEGRTDPSERRILGLIANAMRARLPQFINEDGENVLGPGGVSDVLAAFLEDVCDERARGPRRSMYAPTARGYGARDYNGAFAKQNEDRQRAETARQIVRMGDVRRGLIDIIEARGKKDTDR